jgi:hypothetical protein
MKSVVSGAKFIVWTVGMIFFGRIGKPVIREKDGANAEQNPNEKAGTIMGYEIVDKNGEVHILGNSATIKNAVEKVGEGAIVRIEFLGKGTNAKNQPVNLFKIDELESVEEWHQLDPLDNDGEPDAEFVPEPVADDEPKKGKKK